MMRFASLTTSYGLVGKKERATDGKKEESGTG